MPARNSTKLYLDEGYYHLYNRGVEKRVIFQDEQDYGVFLRYLKEYLSLRDDKDLRNQLLDPSLTWVEKDKVLKLLGLNNFFGEVTLLAYCLIPNHFHLFVKQKSATSIDKFMQSLGTRYSMYFNRKYKRVGSLFQSVYKAAPVESDEQFLELTRYIHSQSLPQGETLQNRQRSSYPEYLGKRSTEWVQTEEVLAFFSRTNPNLTYESFARQRDDFSSIASIIIEE